MARRRRADAQRRRREREAASADAKQLAHVTDRQEQVDDMPQNPNRDETEHNSPSEAPPRLDAPANTEIVPIEKVQDIESVSADPSPSDQPNGELEVGRNQVIKVEIVDKYARIQAVFAAALVFAAIVEGIVLWCQLNAMSKQNTYISQQYDAMLAANKEMKTANAEFHRQNDIMEKQVAQTDETIALTRESNASSEATSKRAQELATEQLKLIRESDKRAMRAYIALDSGDSAPPVFVAPGEVPTPKEQSKTMTIGFINAGATPATDVVISSGYIIAGPEFDGQFDAVQGNEKLGSRFTAGPGYTFKHPIKMEISDVELRDLQSAKKTLWISGQVEYKDVFGERHETTFRLFSMPSRALPIQYGFSPYGNETN